MTHHFFIDILFACKTSDSSNLLMIFSVACLRLLIAVSLIRNIKIPNFILDRFLGQVYWTILQ